MPANYSDRTFLKEAQYGQYGSTAAANPVNAVNQMHQRMMDTLGPQSAATATTGTLYFAGWTTDRAIKVLSVKCMPGGALTANDTNYRTVQLVQNNDLGGADTTIASLTTQTTGTGGSGNWNGGGGASPIQSIAMPVTAANALVAAGQSLQFKITSTGTGVAVPGSTYLQVIYEEV